jgi:hypothetical protein
MDQARGGVGTIKVNCPLCNSTETSEFHRDDVRDYLRCSACRLIFVPPAQFLAPKEEKKRYDTHQNSPDDPEYRRFLSRLFRPLCNRLTPRSRGLDFGSGPGPTLSVMLEEAGHSMEIYDSFYAPNARLLEQRYDFVTATEVAEHLRTPRIDLDSMWSCLTAGGQLGLMTKLARDGEAFAAWHYKLDPTHVNFFSRETFEWQASEWHADVTFISPDVILFRK